MLVGRLLGRGRETTRGGSGRGVRARVRVVFWWEEGSPWLPRAISIGRRVGVWLRRGGSCGRSAVGGVGERYFRTRGVLLC